MRLQGQPIQVLEVLLENAGEVVSREDLHGRLWPDATFGDFDHGLNNAVARIREALGDSADRPRFIETLPRRGYRFIAPIEAPIQDEPEVVQPQPVENEPASSTARWIWSAIAVAVAIAVIGFGFYTRRGREPQIQTIAVLPLANMSGDPSQDYLADGTTEELITYLARSSDLHVISRTSVMCYKQTTKTVPQIAKELGVDAIVEGSIVRSGNRIRITAQLIRAANDRHMWAQEYEENGDDILRLQSAITRDIVRQVSAKVAGRERDAEPKTINLAAHDAYLRARQAQNTMTPEGLEESVQLYNKAIEIDPANSMAYAGLAEAYCWQGRASVKSRELFQQAREAANKALELDSSNASAMKSLAWVHHAYDWDSAAAEDWFHRALAANPSDPVAHAWYGIFLTNVSRPEEGVAEARKAEMLDPLSEHVSDMVVLILLRAHRYPEALKQIERLQSLRPDYGPVFTHLAYYYEAVGNFTGAIDASERALRGGIRIGPVEKLVAERERIAREGAPAYFSALLEYERSREPINSYLVGRLFVLTGRREDGFAMLRRAVQERTTIIRFRINTDFAFDSVRNDPEFLAIVRSIEPAAEKKP